MELVDSLSVLDIILPVADVGVAVSILECTFSRTLVVHPLSVVGGSVAPVEESVSVLHVVQPLAFILRSVRVGVSTPALSLVLVPVAVVLVSVVIEHHAVSVLEVAEPESHIFIIVLEIIRTLAVLLVLQPLSLVAFAVGEGVDAVTASLSLQVGTLVGVAVGVDGGSLALRLSAHHLALILSAVAGGAGTERDFLGRCSQGRERQQQGDHQGLACG